MTRTSYGPRRQLHWPSFESKRVYWGVGLVAPVGYLLTAITVQLADTNDTYSARNVRKDTSKRRVSNWWLRLRGEVHALEEGVEAGVGAEGPPKSEETTPLETADRQEMSAQSNGVRHYRDVASGYTRSPT